MNIPRFQDWSERQQVVAIILAAGGAIFLLWFFLLTPLNHRRRTLEGEIEGMQARLASRNYLVGEEVLQNRKGAEHRHNRALHGEWEEMSRRLAAFTNQQDLAHAQVGIIDFKMKLFDVRQRLLKKSRALDIDLPYNLGMESGVPSNEDARKLMLQLLTIEKLVDLILDLKINEMRSISPLPAIMHGAPGRDVTFMEEYPIRFQFFGRVENLYDLFRAIMEQEHVFVMRHLRAEAETPSTPEVLTIDAVISSLLFVKVPDQVFEPPRIRIVKPGPMGY